MKTDREEICRPVLNVSHCELYGADPSHQYTIHIRPASRLLVIDNQQRLLLIKVYDKQPVHEAFPEMSEYWNIPGGGVEPHETYQQAAQRELWEETGITVDKVDTCVWLHERIIQGDKGRLLLQEHFFVVFVSTSNFTLANLLPNEREAHKAYQWWTYQEISQSSEQFMPVGLAQLVKPLLNGNIPSKPIKLPAYRNPTQISIQQAK